MPLNGNVSMSDVTGHKRRTPDNPPVQQQLAIRNKNRRLADVRPSHDSGYSEDSRRREEDFRQEPFYYSMEAPKTLKHTIYDDLPMSYLNRGQPYW